MAKVLVCPVGSRKSAHAVPLNDSRVSASLCTSDNVNELSGLEDLRDSEFTPGFIIIDIGCAKFAQYYKWTGTSCFAVTKQGFVCTLRLARAKAELKGRVSVPPPAFLLQNR